MCGGDKLLPLHRIPRDTHGTGPLSRRDVWVCDICWESQLASKWCTGGTLTAFEVDMLHSQNMILAAVRENNRLLRLIPAPPQPPY